MRAQIYSWANKSRLSPWGLPVVVQILRTRHLEHHNCGYSDCEDTINISNILCTCNSIWVYFKLFFHSPTFFFLTYYLCTLNELRTSVKSTSVSQICSWHFSVCSGVISTMYICSTVLNTHKKSIIMHFCEVGFTNYSNRWNQMPLKYLEVLLKPNYVFHRYSAKVYLWFSKDEIFFYPSSYLKPLNVFFSKSSDYFMLSILNFS